MYQKIKGKIDFGLMVLLCMMGLCIIGMAIAPPIHLKDPPAIYLKCVQLPNGIDYNCSIKE